MIRSGSNSIVGGRIISYVRTVSLLVQPKIIKKSTCFYSTRHNLEMSIISKNSNHSNKTLHDCYININNRVMGITVHGADVSYRSVSSKSEIISNSQSLSPEEFFRNNGKRPPSDISTVYADITKPITSTTEVVTMGVVKDNFPKILITPSSILVNKFAHYNFSSQSMPDCRVDVTLQNGGVFTYFVDSKTVGLKTFLDNFSYNYNVVPGDKIKCNLYFVGGLHRNYVFSLKEKNGIMNVIMHQCTELSNSKDPLARDFVTENLPMINQFNNTGSLSDLHKIYIAPFIFSQHRYIDWFSKLNNYP